MSNLKNLSKSMEGRGKKVSFNGNTSSFNNSYFCRKFLPQDLMFARIKHNNSNKFFVGSRMEKDRKKIERQIE